MGQYPAPLVMVSHRTCPDIEAVISLQSLLIGRRMTNTTETRVAMQGMGIYARVCKTRIERNEPHIHVRNA